MKNLLSAVSLLATAFIPTLLPLSSKAAGIRDGHYICVATVMSEKVFEVHIDDGKVVNAGDQFGLGRAT